MPQKLTPEIITAAITGFEQQKVHIDTQIADLRAMLPGGRTDGAATPEPLAGKRKRRKMSAAGRKAIAEAQRKRWAASKKAAEPTASQRAPKAKRKLSRAGRAAIVAATKKRWETVRAAKAQQEKAAKKKAGKKKAAVKKAAKKAPVIAKKKAAAKRPQKTAPAPEATTAQAAG